MAEKGAQPRQLRRIPSSTAMAPLPLSSSNVAAAAGLLPVRNTLVAPILPDPIRRRSPSPITLVMTIPKGTDPRR